MRALACVAALLLVSAPVTAHAGSALLDRAQKSMDDIDYDGAQKLIDQAMQEGKLSAEDLARAHMIAGEIAAVLDDTAAARQHFVIWILLDPDAALPDGASPKLTEPFDDAKKQADDLGAMAVDVRIDRAGGSARILLDARDPLNLIVGLRAEGGGHVANERGTSVELPAGDGAMEITVTALDEHDDAIAVRTVTLEARGGSEAPKHPHAVKKGGWPFIVRWPTWTVLSLAGFGTAGYFGWQVQKDHDDLDALNADSMNHTFDEALAIEARGTSHARDADIAIGVGAAFAVIAAVTLAIEPHPHLEVAPTEGGAEVTLAGHF